MMKIDKSKFEGIDVSLEISLYEYGLVWQKLPVLSDEGSRYLFVYGVELDDDNNYIKFDHCTYTDKEFRELCLEDWFDLDAVCSFAGTNAADFIDGFPLSMYSVYQYHNHLDVFGATSYDLSEEAKIV